MPHTQRMPLPASLAFRLAPDLLGDAEVRIAMKRLQQSYPTVYHHSVTVFHYATALGNAAGLSASELRDLQAGALLHDIGKVGIPSEILNRPGPLTPVERRLVMEHPVRGQQTAMVIGCNDAVCQAVRHHHERWDGMGGPDGLTGAAIPRAARLLAVVDAYAAMTEGRPYQPTRTMHEAFGELRFVAGTQLDSRLVSMLANVPAPFLERIRLGLMPDPFRS